jgi:hypothetical protein
VKEIKFQAAAIHDADSTPRRCFNQDENSGRAGSRAKLWIASKSKR